MSTRYKISKELILDILDKHVLNENNVYDKAQTIMNTSGENIKEKIKHTLEEFKFCYGNQFNEEIKKIKNIDEILFLEYLIRYKHEQKNKGGFAIPCIRARHIFNYRIENDYDETCFDDKYKYRNIDVEFKIIECLLSEHQKNKLLRSQIKLSKYVGMDIAELIVSFL